MFKTLLKSFFSPTLRDQGTEFYSAHLVSAFFPTAHGLSLRILDKTSLHLTFEEISEKTWQPLCSCSPFAKEGICKHLWAAFLYIDSEVSKKPDIKIWLKAEKVEAKIKTWFTNKRPPSLKTRDTSRPEWQFLIQAMGEGGDVGSPHATKPAVSREMALVLNTRRSRALDRLVFNLYARGKATERFKKTTVGMRDTSAFPNDQSFLDFFLDLEAAHGDPIYPRTSLELNNIIFPRGRMKGWLVELSENDKLFASAADLGLGKASYFVDHSNAQLSLQTQLQTDGSVELDINISDASWAASCKADGLQIICAAYALLDRRIIQIPPLDNKAKHWLRFIEDRLEIDAAIGPDFLKAVAPLTPTPKASSLGESESSNLPEPKASLTFVQREVEEEKTCEGLIHFHYESTGKRPLKHSNREAEERWRKSLADLPEIVSLSKTALVIPSRSFAESLAQLAQKGWSVYLDKTIVTFATPKPRLSQAKNWLELNLNIDGMELDLESVIRSVKKPNAIVKLSDGSARLITPYAARILQRLFTLLKRRGDTEVLDIKQIALIDSLLDGLSPEEPSAPQIAYRSQLAGALDFQDAAIDPSPHFQGTLRPYQKDGLTWLSKMTQLSLGVCLADEMGLGKTIQLIALLELRQCLGRPDLIIMPRSLIGNWKAELQRFAPRLRVLDYSGTNRGKEDFDGADIVLTTYGVLLREDEAMMGQTWHHVVLDEAQAIKNIRSQTAQAAFRLKAEYRLALSGTPLENNSAELVSLFRFLNPDMLGPEAEKTLLEPSRDPEILSTIARSLRPFLLRRRKEDVVKDLPEKLVLTLNCEMTESQKKIYAEYLIYYKIKIAEKIAKDGFGQSKLLMIEALLRLRQIACHPLLVNPQLEGTESAKLEALMEKLEELHGSEDKVLIFSQFTSFLQIIESRLKQDGISYTYLDGKTRDRTQRVADFQADPSIKVFLISLKAGGVGLNLTAARYAFIMDPWWNPAVEEQAMARAHRIGQQKQVIVYKVIAQDTIEEKILVLQNSKQELVREFIDGEGSGAFTHLNPDDLELLMS